ncbi:universal stress protein [Pontibacter beigongshangensis]|uniref:universal stress protein n=1 Tax=Pontibacter beigongshangensis TaxID=2574733 RepID=UPI00165072E2|nr:universal stress protein [Pontibacter beigongshangensis]
MKNILFSTDLTKNASNIALYAAELCRHVGARLIIFHGYEPAKFNGEQDDNAEEMTQERAVQTKMDNLTRKLKLVPGLSITRLLRPAMAENETAYIARKVKADLVIISSGSLGTDTASIKCHPVLQALTQACIPTLVVPPKASFCPYSRVALLAEPNEQEVYYTGMNFLKHLADTKKELRLMKHLQTEQALVPAGAEATVPGLGPNQTIGADQAFVDKAQEDMAGFVRLSRSELIMMLLPADGNSLMFSSPLKLLHTKFTPILLLPQPQS